jgi:L-serine dehydratase
MLGLSGLDPEEFPTKSIPPFIDGIRKTRQLIFGGDIEIPFQETSIVFNRTFLPFHPNGIRFTAYSKGATLSVDTYYSIGGGFVVREELRHAKENTEIHRQFPFPIQKAKQLEDYCRDKGRSIDEIVLENERSLRSDREIDHEIRRIWTTMLHSMYDGCHTEGILPGGLDVRRRAFDLHQKLKGKGHYTTPEEWMAHIRKSRVKFREILKWVSCFALAVNEVNASLGRVVTAPTNGSAGVIPAVLMYHLVIEAHDAGFDVIKKFLLVAGEIGSIFKKGATISAAMGGCQAEIGVSSAMAAGGLTAVLGGSPEQVLMASEIAMEHHLGLTCDPVNGLVQIPCIERNTMGAIKAIHAAELAMDSDSAHAKVPLDTVIDSMWKTARDMDAKYKETSTGGLAVSVKLSDC